MFISRRKTIEILKNSGLVALKSDTIYGLSACVYAKNSLKKIFAIKKRDSSKPLITLFDSIDSLIPFIQPLSSKQLLALQQYWPGPVTFILELKKNHKIDPIILGNKTTIAARVPQNKDLREILKQVGPIVSTSINKTNEEPIQSPDQIKNLAGFDIGIYEGKSEVVQSTISTIFCFKRGVLREGSIPISHLTTLLQSS